MRRVREHMVTGVETLRPDSTMEDAVLLQMRRKIRHIPIVVGDRLVGIVTDRDIKRAMPSLLTGTNREEHERVTRATHLERIMTKDPLTTTPDAPLRDVVKVMAERKFGALPVVDGSKLVGIITETDMLRVLAALLDREP